MHKTLKKTLLAASALGVSMIIGISAADAQVSRVYFAGYLGLNTYSDREYTESTTASSGDMGVNNAVSFAGALGVRLSHQMRMEAEYSYRNSEFGDLSVNGVGGFNQSGKLKSSLAFVNLYYDFDVPWVVQPFVGGGIGYGWHTANIGDGSGQLPDVTADASSLAWNVGGGLKYRPRTDFAFTAGYRYVDAFDLELSSYEVDYGSHELRVGVEWDLPTGTR